MRKIYEKLNYIDRNFKVEYLMNLNTVNFKISEKLESNFNTESKKANHMCYQNKIEVYNIEKVKFKNK